MRAMLSVIFYTLGWVIWLPVVGYFLLSVLSGQGDLATSFVILVGGCFVVAPVFYLAQRLKHPAPPKERPQKRVEEPPARDPLPEAPPVPQGRKAAVPPFARGVKVQPVAARSAIPGRLQRFMKDGAQKIEQSK